MAAPLDEKAFPAHRFDGAKEVPSRASDGSAPPSPSEMEVEATAWEGYWPGAGSISSTTKLTKNKDTAARWQDDGAEIEPLVTLSQAQSSLAARDAQVLRLTEENEALRKERTSLIETKREQIERLQSHWKLAEEQVAEQMVTLNSAGARIKALEEALREISRDVVHTSFGAKPTRGAEIARTTLKENAL